MRGANRLRVERRAPWCSTALPGRGDAVAGSLGDEPSLEVRDGAEDVEQGSTKIRGVNLDGVTR